MGIIVIIGDGNMFTEKERINLILSYGLEDAIELYNKYNDHAYKHLNQYKNFNKQLKQKYQLPEKLSLAISYIELCYCNHLPNHEEILDFFHTLRAIERQVVQ